MVDHIKPERFDIGRSEGIGPTDGFTVFEFVGVAGDAQSREYEVLAGVLAEADGDVVHVGEELLAGGYAQAF